MPELITSRDNQRVKYACKLAKSAAFREEEQCFLAEGYKLCLDLAKLLPLKVIFYTEKALQKSVALAGLPGEQFLIEPHVAEKMAQVDANQGVFAVFEMPKTGMAAITAALAAHPNGGARLLALECVQDPGNVGTLIRSAAAFGFDAVLLSRECASPFAPKTLRSSVGAVAAIPVAVCPGTMAEAIAELTAQGVTSLAAALYNSKTLGENDWSVGDQNLCVVIGSEGQGLTAETVAACTMAVRIPMSARVESLNAGVAGSVLLWQFRGSV